ncbi:hypothetical protein DFJ63DRAFT_334660 [Scheffersomyces coipomensis]|uniref:uncharacterized protein n=1 Tax=Scheffersomyces coipomensis TaxID=1788519 RepID=UPI00315D25E5
MIGLGLKRRIGRDELRRLTTATIAEKAEFTGSGPFIELPQFRSIGNPSKLLNITLPQSSRLNIRHGSMVAINGDLSQLVSYTRSLTKFTQYEELHSGDSVSVVINGNNKNYAIIDAESKSSNVNNTPWIVLNDENIIAWTGYNFELKSKSILDKYRSFETSGKGTLVINGDNELFSIQLNPNESLLVNPSTLIATNGSISFKVLDGQNNATLTNILKSIPSINLPTVGIIGSFVNSIRARINSLKALITTNQVIVDINRYIGTTSQYIAKIYDSIKLSLTGTIIKKRPIYIEIKGPSKLIINNNTSVPNHRLFTKTEIEKIYNQHYIE